jgi:CubicO group peptidase (beta-lactamase class C family)
MFPDLRRRLGAVAVALLLASAATPGQQISALTPGGFFPPLEAYLESLRLQAGIPAMSAAVVQNGEIVWERGFGFQNVASRIRATPDTPYAVGDLSETLAAVLLLQCVEERRLDLDEPIRRYGVDSPESGVRLRQMLSHTAGEAGSEVFAYSAERFAELTSVVEWCVPQPYRKSVEHRLLKRLAMKDSVPGTDLQDPDITLPEDMFDPADLDRYRRVLDRIAVPYKVQGRSRPERTEPPPSPMTTSAGLVSTVRDLARFDAAIDSSLLLRDDTLALAWTPVIPRAGGPALPTGLGWFVQTYRNERIVWHFGVVANAYSSLIVKLPARRLTFILLANSDGLCNPFQLSSGDVTRSVFATLFLRLIT